MNGIYSDLKVARRGCVVYCGQFTTANTSTPTSQVGKMATVTRSGVGTFVVTIPKKLNTIFKVASVDNSATDDKVAVRHTVATTSTTTTITIVVYDVSGAAAADTTGQIVDWMLVHCGATD